MIPGMKQYGFEAFAVCFDHLTKNMDLTALAPRVMAELEGTDIEISALGRYGNPLAVAQDLLDLQDCIDKAHLFGCSTVSCFSGALPGTSVEESFPAFIRIFSEICKRAKDKGVTLVLENCMMGGTWHRLTYNMAFCPRTWEMIFDALPFNNLGLEWEPAHAMSQMIDPIEELRQWAKKVYHVHGKDASVDWTGLRREGIFCGRNFIENRTPGFGDTNWRDVFSILRSSGFEGVVSIEGYHDPVYGGEWELTGQIHGLNYLKWARGGKFARNCWTDAQR